MLVSSFNSTSSASAAINLIFESLSNVPASTALNEKVAVSVKVPILPPTAVSVMLSAIMFEVSIKAVESVTSLNDCPGNGASRYSSFHA